MRLLLLLVLPSTALAAQRFHLGVGSEYVHLAHQGGGRTLDSMHDASFHLELDLGWRFRADRDLMFQLGWQHSRVSNPNMASGQQMGELSWAAGGPGLLYHLGERVVIGGGAHLVSASNRFDRQGEVYAPLGIMPWLSVGYEWPVMELLRVSLAARGQTFSLDHGRGVESRVFTAGLAVGLVVGGGPAPAR